MSAFEYEHAPAYDNNLFALHYYRDGTVKRVEPEITEMEAIAWDLAHELGQQALLSGNPPVGALMLVNDGEHVFGGKTSDKTTRKIGAHAELVAYDDAHEAVGDDLTNSVLATTAVPCTTCAPPFAEGKIKKIIASVPRRYVWQLTGIMRPRNINLHELLMDGDTDTVTVMNFGLEKSLGMFATYGKMVGHKTPENLDPFLRRFVEEANAA